MKFNTVLVGLFAALAAAAPAPQPQELSANIQEDVKLEARQGCGRCYSGTRTCCGAHGCTMVRC